jgi:hypothetical protein
MYRQFTGGIMKKTNDVPRWNLNSLFPDIGTPEYNAVLTGYIGLLDEADSILHVAETLEVKNVPASNTAGFDFPLWLSRFLELENRLGAT